MTILRKCIAAALLAAALSSVSILPAAAMASNARPTLAEVEEEVMCSVCGVPLSLAREAPAAKRERALISSLIKQGMTKQQIEDQLVTTYGQQVLATPKAKGFDIWAWIIPAAAFVLALAGLGYLLARWSRRAGSTGDSAPSSDRLAPLSDADAARVDAELKAQD